MQSAKLKAVAIVAVLTGLGSFPVCSAEALKRGAILEVNRAYEKRTVIKPSTIPGAGNGLFALGAIMRGEVIGEMGGRLVSDQTYPQDSRYIANLPECVWPKMYPYKYIDGKDNGTHVSQINFAPSEINGLKTGFQNAEIRQSCDAPYFIHVALRDIDPGEEILSSYGPNYRYGDFMEAPEIRTYFCGLMKIDCSKSYSWLH